MATTFLNPTLWLLAAVLGAAAIAVFRRGSARAVLDRVLSLLLRRPVLVVLGAAVLVSLGGRLFLGFIAPGSYAEDVLGARNFLAERQLYHGDDRADFEQWLQEEPPVVNAWTLPGFTPCKAYRLEHRPQLYSQQGHSPMLLIASAPLVWVVGGRGLYVVVVVASLVALWFATLALCSAAGLEGPSAVLALLAIAGWQPVIAAFRQGDIVLVAACVSVLGWSALRRGRPLAAGVAAGCVAILLPPALVLLIPVAFRHLRSAATGAAVFVALAGLAFALGGPLVFGDYLSAQSASAQFYAQDINTYAAIGRLLLADAGRPGLAIAAAAILLLITAIVAFRTRPEHGTGSDAPAWTDATCAAFVVLAFLFYPVAWSQHATLLLLPVAVFLARVVARTGAAALALWAGTAILLSLPDFAVGRLTVLLRAAFGFDRVAAFPPIPVAAALICWAALLWLSLRNTRAREIA